MNLTVSVEPTEEPLTVDEQKTWSRITDAAEDAHLETLITGARVHVEQYLGRALMEQTLVAKWDCWPCEFELERAPVQSITSIQYIDVDGVTRTVSSSNYYTDLDSTPPRICRKNGYTWPILQLGRPNAVTVTYVAGYASADDVPRPIKMAISMLVDHWYENRGPVLVGAILAEIPLTVQALLGPYRIWC